MRAQRYLRARVCAGWRRCAGRRRLAIGAHGVRDRASFGQPSPATADTGDRARTCDLWFRDCQPTALDGLPFVRTGSRIAPTPPRWDLPSRAGPCLGAGHASRPVPRRSPPADSGCRQAYVRWARALIALNARASRAGSTLRSNLPGGAVHSLRCDATRRPQPADRTGGAREARGDSR
jgi:hypothetical protein